MELLVDSRLFDHNPATGITEIFHYDETTGNFTIEERQEINDLVEQNKYLQNEDTDRYQESHRVASIPLSIYWELKRNGTIDDKRKFRAWLNDSANMAFRTKLGRV